MSEMIAQRSEAGGRGGLAEADEVGAEAELEQLRRENRRLAISLGAFSAFLASKGLLEEAWTFIHRVHGLDQGDE